MLRPHKSRAPVATPPVRAKNAPHVRGVLDGTHNDPTKQVNLPQVVARIVALAQVVSEKSFYPYQTAISSRLVESVLLHDGEVITALISRQSGKTQTVGSTVAALMLIVPHLCDQFPDSWHFNITDDKGVYRGFNRGIEVGIYAPRKEQSKIAFDRVKECFDREATKQVMSEMGIIIDTFNGTTIKLSNGSMSKCETASEQSKIEGETYHLLILEEAQDISDMKIRKSLHPMVSSTMGTILKVGTAKAERCDFYHAIKTNIRADMEGRTSRKNNFFFPYSVCQKYNSRYRDYIEKEKVRIGEDSDEFKLSYGCVWIFERGMFVTNEQLLDKAIAQTALRPWAETHVDGVLPIAFSYYSVVAGIDWGSSHDSTVVTLVAVNWKNPEDTIVIGRQEVHLYKKHVLEWREYIGDDYETQYWEITQYLSRVPHLAKIVMDSNACGRPIFDRFRAAYSDKMIEIVPVNFQPQVKSDGYKSLYQDICGKRLTFPASLPVRKTQEYRKFVHQMLDLRKKYAQGRMQVSHPDEKHAHDDYPDSLMVACLGAATASGFSELEYSDSNFFYAQSTSGYEQRNNSVRAN